MLAPQYEIVIYRTNLDCMDIRELKPAANKAAENLIPAKPLRTAAPYQVMCRYYHKRQSLYYGFIAKISR